MSEWRPIKTFRGRDYHKVDIWMAWGAWPSTMGMADAFRVTEAYRKGGKWFHYQDGKERELRAEYIWCWMPIPKPPASRLLTKAAA